MSALVDVNVLLPIALSQHSLRNAAVDWWDRAPDSSVVLCLPVRMAVLRLLTNRTVMGDDVLQPESAWAVWAKFCADDRTLERYDTPDGLDMFWFQNVTGRDPSPKLWTDAWLAAFAECAGYEMVTFDRGFRSFSITDLHLLEA
ncbi:MAG: type II toxin-antitoxin system VapC family toxin [Verrucomicrobia bacterium]|nr:type II toxin-antitoxin system VapC family toxin [Verrucomicrobiota bacterium]MDA1087415.1 type II toxin-antitoxin system VapC family toxin [Verrucomicrobiota bacterium]